MKFYKPGFNNPTEGARRYQKLYTELVALEDHECKEEDFAVCPQCSKVNDLVNEQQEISERWSATWATSQRANLMLKLCALGLALYGLVGAINFSRLDRVFAKHLRQDRNTIIVPCPTPEAEPTPERHNSLGPLPTLPPEMRK